MFKPIIDDENDILIKIKNVGIRGLIEFKRISNAFETVVLGSEGQKRLLKKRGTYEKSENCS